MRVAAQPCTGVELERAGVAIRAPRVGRRLERKYVEDRIAVEGRQEVRRDEDSPDPSYVRTYRTYVRTVRTYVRARSHALERRSRPPRVSSAAIAPIDSGASTLWSRAHHDSVE